MARHQTKRYSPERVLYTRGIYIYKVFSKVTVSVHTSPSLSICLCLFTHIYVSWPNSPSLYTSHRLFPYVYVSLHIFMSLYITHRLFTDIPVSLHKSPSLYTYHRLFPYVYVSLHTFMSLFKPHMYITVSLQKSPPLDVCQCLFHCFFTFTRRCLIVWQGAKDTFPYNSPINTQKMPYKHSKEP